jgi:hypothetical protein
MSDIYGFCVGDLALGLISWLGGGNPNSGPCNRVAMNSPNTAAPLAWAGNKSGSQVLIDLCGAGNDYACRNADMPKITAQESADMAQRRDEMATADRAALAERLENVGQDRVAASVRRNTDLVYNEEDEIVDEIVTTPLGPVSVHNPVGWFAVLPVQKKVALGGVAFGALLVLIFAIKS